MRARRQVWAVLFLGLSAPFLHARAEGLTSYLESSGSEQKPRSNAGLTLQGDRLRMRADLALRGRQQDAPRHALLVRPSGSTEVVPSLRSAFKLAKNLNLETAVNFAEWNASSATTLDTRLKYQKPLRKFFDQLDGTWWRSPEGATKQSLRLGFHEVLGDAGARAPLTLSGEATFEATQPGPAAAADSTASRRVRLEARVAGRMPAFFGADHALGLKVERAVGGPPESASSLTYNPSWNLSSLTQLVLNLQLSRRTYSPAHDLAPSLDFTWHSRF